LIRSNAAEQSSDMKASIALARAEFISTHRPRILVYGLNIVLKKPDDPEKLAVSFRYVNAGDSTATITGWGTKLIVLYKPTVPSNVEFEHIVHQFEIKSGEHSIGITTDTFPWTFTGWREHAIAQQARFICIGYIKYRDGNDTLRQTGFCREYDPESNRWVKIADDEYEYSY
jgi:hypothetical protein